MFDAMKQLAEKKHGGQFRNVRKGEVAIPYIRHPESVAKNLLDWGEPEDSVAIGIAWGHDLLEDTETSLDEIIAASDETVAAGIRLLTHEDGTDKRRYLQNVARSGSSSGQDFRPHPEFPRFSETGRPASSIPLSP